MTHNEAIELLVKEAASSDKKRLTELFLQTLVNGQIHFGLQVLSKMKTFHVHSYSYLNIPKTGDRFKDDRLIAKEYKKPVLERNVIAFEDMPKEQQAEILNQLREVCKLTALSANSLRSAQIYFFAMCLFYVLANLSVIWRNILTTLLLDLVMIIFMRCCSAYGKKIKRAKVLFTIKGFKMKDCIFLKKSLKLLYL